VAARSDYPTWNSSRPRVKGVDGMDPGAQGPPRGTLKAGPNPVPGPERESGPGPRPRIGDRELPGRGRRRFQLRRARSMSARGSGNHPAVVGVAGRQEHAVALQPRIIRGPGCDHHDVASTIARRVVPRIPAQSAAVGPRSSFRPSAYRPWVLERLQHLATRRCTLAKSSNWMAVPWLLGSGLAPVGCRS